MWRRIGWFAAFWVLGVGVLGAVAYTIRLAL